MSALRLVSLIEQIAHEERPTQIHSSPCAHCPSVAMPNDPEMIDLRDRGTRAEQLESVFRCAWRRDKACRGYCDKLGISAADLEVQS
jgi:hypothetical protein